MKRLLLLFSILCMCSFIYAQENPVRGFIITNAKDTIYGSLDYRTNSINCKQCYFKADNESEYMIYHPGEIEGYRFMSNGKFYVSRTFVYNDKPEKCFAEYMVKGTMNLYRVSIGSYYVFFIEDENGEIISYERDDDHSISRERSIEKIRPIYEKVTFVGDGSLEKDLKPGGMKESEMIRLVRDYHKFKCTSNEDCIEFEYDEKKERNEYHYNVHAGVIFLASNPNSNIKGNKFTFGAGCDISLKRLMKNLEFQLSLDFGSGSVSIAKNYFEKNYFANLNLGPALNFDVRNMLKLVVHGGYSAYATYFKDQYDTAKNSGLDFGSSLYLGAGVKVPVKKGSILFMIDYKDFNHVFYEGHQEAMVMSIGYIF